MKDNLMVKYIPSREIFMKLVRFLLAGLPAFFVALSLNAYLVEVLYLKKWITYAIVLVVQVTINFFAIILFVFKRDKTKNIFNQYLLYLSGNFTARLLDWCVYVVLAEWVGLNYLIVQFVNVVFFSIARFAFAKKTIEG